MLFKSATIPYAADGYDVDYLRVPVTDEKAPKDSDFEVLVQRLHDVPSDAVLVFNCQMGRGRTTTGMIIASLLHLWRLKAFPGSSPAGACRWTTCGLQWLQWV